MPSYFAPEQNVMQENITVSEWINKYNKQCKMKNIDTSNYAGYAYDAVWTYALALDKLIKVYPEALNSIHSKNTAK